MNFKKWVKSIQTAGYNGARKVNEMCCLALRFTTKVFFYASGLFTKIKSFTDFKATMFAEISCDHLFYNNFKSSYSSTSFLGVVQLGSQLL